MELKQWHEYVDVIYYINLDIREDRNAQFLEEMRRMGVPPNKIIRFSAIYKPNQGDLGCSMSHLKCIQMFNDSKFENCIIFEDDFIFTQNLETINKMFQYVFNNNIIFDVLMISASEMNTTSVEHEYLKRVIDAQTASGYIVNKRFSPILTKNYEDGLNLLEQCHSVGQDIWQRAPYCVDAYWKKLQPTSEWFVFSPKLGLQKPGWSTIVQRYVDYGV
jgi:glycosyl transferase family 25